jgi:hypothetical protein
MGPIALTDLRQIGPFVWEIPRKFRNDMRVNALGDQGGPWQREGRRFDRGAWLL